jgi:hypothetical protein
MIPVFTGTSLCSALYSGLCFHTTITFNVSTDWHRLTQIHNSCIQIIFFVTQRSLAPSGVKKAVSFCLFSTLFGVVGCGFVLTHRFYRGWLTFNPAGFFIYKTVNIITTKVPSRVISIRRLAERNLSWCLWPFSAEIPPNVGMTHTHHRMYWSYPNVLRN